MTVKQKISSWNAQVNSLLKDIAKLAEIDETISMHVARHSFAQYGMGERDLYLPDHDAVGTSKY